MEITQAKSHVLTTQREEVEKATINVAEREHIRVMLGYTRSLETLDKKYIDISKVSMDGVNKRRTARSHDYASKKNVQSGSTCTRASSSLQSGVIATADSSRAGGFSDGEETGEAGAVGDGGES